ncbi:MAG TPA: agmatine deiminase family protein [Candidatus Deferrimicrobiaceae bacterium]
MTASAPQQTPAAAGFRMPAEWERHAATWIGWPHNPKDWPGKFAPIPWVFGEIVRKLSPGETVRIIVEDAAHEAKARRVLAKTGVDPTGVEFFRFPTDRGWTRDMGPIFVAKEGRNPEAAVVGFGFNAWAKYDNWKKDAKTHARGAKALGLPLLPALRPDTGKPFVLEGGAIDVNGRGTLLTTEECLLDPGTQVRNPGLSKAGTEQALRDHLGVTNVVWLGKGIAGDDTHGHVDDLCRFVNPTTVVLCDEKNPKDANYAPLSENRERLSGARLEDGGRISVVPLPMPAPLMFDGVRLPASYANFYIGNAAVIVPTFNDPNDRVALGILAELFPDRPVVGIHAVDLVWGFGTLHCLTQQQPAS